MLKKDIFLVPELKPLCPNLEHTWKGKVAGTEDKYDIQKWEAILNGTHVRIMHSLNDQAKLLFK